MRAVNVGSGKSSMSNLLVRTLFALGATPVVLFLIWYNEFTRNGMMVVLIGVAAWEWARMVAMKVPGPAMTIGSPIVSGLLVIGWVLEKKVPGILLLVGSEITLLYLFVGFARVKIDHLFPWILLHASGPLYLGLWGGMMVSLFGEGRGFASSAPFIVVMVSMWVSDTFAYFTGRLIGKHKMAPEISPKKTWEGAVGGTVFTMAFVVWLGPWAFGTGLVVNLALGFILSVAGQIGDLFESVLKRWAGAKDSSQFFPGHGGVLDRLDSLFMAAPLTVVLMGVLKSLA
jgi:phosphatidate cytidylyltransferase